MDFLSNLLGKYFLLSLIGQQAVDDNNYYCYSTDKAKAQQKHYSLQTKHDKYINKKENTMPGKHLSSFVYSNCIVYWNLLYKL